MTSPYLELVQTHAALLQRHDLPLLETLRGRELPPRAEPAADAPVALLLSPHPDDECITGALALRLARECGYRVVNLPVTFGSNPRRQKERKHELERACAWLGFEIAEIEADGFARVNAQAREKEPEAWLDKVETVAARIRQLKPAIVVCPNHDDGHATHIGTYLLATDALALAKHRCWLAQTEFWRAMANPNLLVESRITDVADLVAALACHVGEVKRNPYHLRLTSWLADNVRRGAELLGGAGGTAPDFAFGTLYRIDRFDGVQLVADKHLHIVSAHASLTELLG